MSRAPWIIEFVTIGMVVLGPLSVFGAIQAKKQNWLLHKKIQTTIAVILLITVIMFEFQVRFMGWRFAAVSSPYYESLVFPVLYLHIPIAVFTTWAWIKAIWEARKYFTMISLEVVPRSKTHRFWGKLAVIGTQLTWITGTLFFYLAFVA